MAKQNRISRWNDPFVVSVFAFGVFLLCISAFSLRYTVDASRPAQITSLAGMACGIAHIATAWALRMSLESTDRRYPPNRN